MRTQRWAVTTNIHDIVADPVSPCTTARSVGRVGLARGCNKHDPDGAQIAFEEALKIDPAHTGSRLGMARIPLEAKDFRRVQSAWPVTFLAADP